MRAARLVLRVVRIRSVIVRKDLELAPYEADPALPLPHVAVQIPDTAQSLVVAPCERAGAGCTTISSLADQSRSCLFANVTCSAAIGAATKVLLRSLALLPDEGAVEADYEGDYYWLNNGASMQSSSISMKAFVMCLRYSNFSGRLIFWVRSARVGPPLPFKE